MVHVRRPARTKVDRTDNLSMLLPGDFHLVIRGALTYMSARDGVSSRRDIVAATFNKPSEFLVSS
jgi:hypothetical protein